MSFQINIFNKSNHSDYLNLLKSHNLELDVYYLPAFLETEEKIHNGSYEIFTLSKGQSVFIYPYIKLNFSGEYEGFIDLISPYGYCGPFCNDRNVFDQAEKAFLDTLGKNIVTEFVRYHYQYNNNLKFKVNITNLENRTIVLLNLQDSWEDIWSNSFSSTNRNLIKKLEKEGYSYSQSSEKSDIANFIELYYKTMNHTKASSFYYFKPEIIEELFRNLGNNIFLAKVEKDSVVYSSSLFFISGGIITYYLSARNLEFSKVPSSNFMLSNTAKWAKENNLNYMNFGGGLTQNQDDPLFKFKSNFSKTYVPFEIGKRVHNTEIYKELANNWINEHGKEDFDKKEKTSYNFIDNGLE